MFYSNALTFNNFFIFENLASKEVHHAKRIKSTFTTMEDLYLLRRTFPSTNLKVMFIPLIWLYLASKAGQTRRKLLLLQSVQDREEIGRIQKPLFCGNSTKLLIPWESLLVKQRKPIQADGKTLRRISIGN